MFASCFLSFDPTCQVPSAIRPFHQIRTSFLNPAIVTWSADRKSDIQIMDSSDIKFQTVKEILEGSGPRDIQRATSLISDLKKDLLKHKYLSPEEPDQPAELRVRFRDVLEFEALINIRRGRLDDFERSIAQLKWYYFPAQELAPSHRMPLIISIHLVHLLAQKKTVDFNIELQLARTAIGPNEYIQYASDLHESIITNSFSRLFSLEAQMPSDLFQVITAELMDGARHSHADSIERSYLNLTLAELTTILHFGNGDEARQFAIKREWQIADGGDIVVFSREEGEKGKPNVDMFARVVDLSTLISSLG
jgi:hypothetical protein